MKKFLSAVGVAALVASFAGTGFAGDTKKKVAAPKTEKACAAAAKKNPDAGWAWDKAAKKCHKADHAAAAPATTEPAATPPTEEAAPAEDAEGGSY